MPKKDFPSFPYGAVYFRWSSPPRQDWERDYQTAAEDGATAFRHWFLWSVIERSRGVFEWDSFDRHLDLAAKHGIKTIIAERTRFSPEWTYQQFAHARAENRDGKKLSTQTVPGCAAGGANGGNCALHKG